MTLSSVKRKTEESSNEGGSSDATKLTSPRASPVKSRARSEEKRKEEEEASNRVSPPSCDVEMQDMPHDEGAVNIAVGALDVPAIEEVRTVEVPAIGAERARADSTEGVRPPPGNEEAKEDESLGSHMIECAKLTHEWVEVSYLHLSFCEADLFLEVLSCNTCVFVRILWICQSRLPRSWLGGAPPTVR